MACTIRPFTAVIRVQQVGATTLSITALSIMTLSIVDLIVTTE
jgi:hypothetical protein